MHPVASFFLTALLPHSFGPGTAQYKPATTTFKTPSPTSGIEPGPPAWESSTLTSEPLDVARNDSINKFHYDFSLFFSFCGVAAQRGPGPPHS